MPRNGTGTYTLPYNWNDDLANGITIQAGRMMGQQDDIATGLTNSIAKDGQTPYTGNQSMGNNKITNLGNSTDARDAIPTAQVQNSSLFYLGTSLGVADAYTAAAVPAITAYEATMSFRLKIHATNTTTTPTLQLNGIGNPALDGVIKKITPGGLEVALAAGDLDAGAYYDFQRNSANNAWILMNENKADVPQATWQVYGKSLLDRDITIANDASAPSTTMVFGNGNFVFDDYSGSDYVTAKRKQLNGPWAAGGNQNGLDTGTRQANTWYYMYAIENPTTSVTDFLFTASYDNPTMPTGYTKKRYLGAVSTGNTGNINQGRWGGKGVFEHAEPGLVYTTPFNNTVHTINLLVPPIPTMSRFNVHIEETTFNQNVYTRVVPAWQGQPTTPNAYNTTLSLGSDADAIGRPVRNDNAFEMYLTNGVIYGRADGTLTVTIILTFGYTDLNVY